ncbi:MAG: DUF445 domain-containing protein [Sphingomonas sp.]|uniref:DUF445 domain-containing protein n=1 Tax=Sphingomonas sp. TaxID=28214 RepID=UPI003F81727B
MKLARLPIPGPAAAPPALRRMRLVATSLLIAMAVLFFVARALGERHPAWGFVRAFAEAAMVGGLADWFAVTALFRHPLGLPIPHTAIVPRNKDRIGDTLAQFLRDNFLIPGVVARRMRRLDVAGAAGRWLASPKGATEGRLRRGASRLAADMLEALDQERLGGMVRATLAQRLRSLEISPLLGNALSAAIADNRHVPLLDGIIRWSAKVLSANEPVIRAMVHERAGSLMRWTGLDETLANKIIAGLDGMIQDMASQPDHPLRAKAEEGLAQLAHDLQHDPAMRERVEGFKAEMLDNPALSDWWQGIWEQMRGAMLKIARDPDAMLAGRFGEAMRQLGTTLQEDAELASTINRFARRAAVGAAADYGDAIVRLVSETVRGWDARTITRRLENAVGRDLQYIRVNGTLVGGLVGLAIHTVDVLL